ncbi:hypothetical protein QZH41_016555 [Actinostola sp. cb2023]|nr:hypothetical protein QZH41_016555 [Actinostola sp. cb2023]
MYIIITILITIITITILITIITILITIITIIAILIIIVIILILILILIIMIIIISSSRGSIHGICAITVSLHVHVVIMLLLKVACVYQGHVRHNWKTRWFVLYDERLCYFKKKEDKEPAGYVLLLGCFLVSPCTEYTKKESVFRLTSREGIEYLIQAVNNEERDKWTNDIAECIRKLEARDRKSKVATESKRLPDVNAENFKEPLSRIREEGDGRREEGGKRREERGERKEEGGKRREGDGRLEMGGRWEMGGRREGDGTEEGGRWEGGGREMGLRREGDGRREEGLLYFENNSKKVPEFRHVSVATIMFTPKRYDEHPHHFCVGVPLGFFPGVGGRFSHIWPGLYGDMPLDRSALRFSSNQDVLDFDSSDESSDSDDEPIKIPCDVIRGTIVKQGFLEKKGHLRHNWKTRKFILCTDPPILYYCKPSKGDLPVGQLKLERCEIKLLTKDDEILTDGQTCVADSSNQTQKYPIMLRTRKGVKYVLRAASEMDRLEWIESLQGVADEPND